MGRLRGVSIVLVLTPIWSGCPSGGAPPPPAADAALESGSGADRASDDSLHDERETVDAGPDAGPDTSLPPEDAARDVPTGVDGGVNDGGPEDGATGLEKTDAYPAVVFPPENPYSESKALLGK